MKWNAKNALATRIVKILAKEPAAKRPHGRDTLPANPVSSARTTGGTPSNEDFYNPRHWLATLLVSCALLSAGVPLSSAAGKNRPHAPQAAAKPDAKRELLPAPDITASAWGLAGASDSVKSESVKCDLPGISQARRITITKPTPAAYWQIQLAQDTPAALANNTTLRLHFWARSKTKNSVYAVYEHNAAPNEKYLNLMLVLTPEWKEYSLVLTTPREIPANFTGVRFQCGLKEGEIEIAGAGLEDWGRQSDADAARHRN